MKVFPLITAPLFGFFLSSCGAVDMVKNTASSTTEAVSDFSLPNFRPAKLAIVEAREKDLKEIPLGKDQALAFENAKAKANAKKRSFWSFVNFKEPVLPEFDEGEMDGSLLPPREL